MPEFVNPFSGVTPGRTLTKRELTRGIRLSLSAEQEAVHLYEALADATDDPLAKAVLQEIANEERVHAGEFQRLLNILLPDEEQWMTDGAGEVDDMVDKLKSQGPGAAGAIAAETAKEEANKGTAHAPAGEIPTIGNMRA